MKRYIATVAVLALLSLGACADKTGGAVSDAADCSATLVAAGTSSSSAIVGTAATAPSCQRLALDALNEVIKLAHAKAAAARAAAGRQ